jgi:hypothetical protein
VFATPCSVMQASNILDPLYLHVRVAAPSAPVKTSGHGERDARDRAWTSPAQSLPCDTIRSSRMPSRTKSSDKRLALWIRLCAPP